MKNKTLIIGKCNDYITNFLIEQNFDLFIIKPNEHLDRRLQNHADLSVLKLDDIFIVDDNQEDLINYLKNSDKKVIPIKFSSNFQYPNDCILNFAKINHNIIGNNKAVTDVIKYIFENFHYSFYNVNQGYAKCSTLSFGNSAITDDESIYHKLQELNIESMIISKNQIKLSGYNYGFIGGASFTDEYNKDIYFFGDITKIREWHQIKTFISSRGYSIKFINNRELTDIGGAVII